MSKLHDEFEDPRRVVALREQLEREGCFLIPDAYAREACEEIVRWIDGEEGDPKAEINYSGTETRLWGAESKHPGIAAFREESDRALATLLEAKTEAYTVLAIRNRAVDRGDAAANLGRWHTDSFRQQYKVFLFLTDVVESSGPFEYLPRTHRPSFKLSMAVRGVYFGPTDLIKGTRSYTRLNEGYIDRLAERGFRSKPVTCAAGTIMIVNTSAIHRARPCMSGARYALTSYYR